MNNSNISSDEQEYEQPVDSQLPSNTNMFTNDQEFNQPADELLQDPNGSLNVEELGQSEASLDEVTPYRLRGPYIKKMETPNLFSGAPPIPGTARDLAIGEAPDEYKVELGDTLIDICDQLIDEPGYWPKLWSLNPYIKNPHFIFPGMKLRFFMGSEETPPFLQVVSEDDLLPVNSGDLKEDEVLNTRVDKLFSKVRGEYEVPVISDDEIKRFPEIDEAFVKEGSIFRASSKEVIIPAFVFKEEVEALGTVVSGTSGSFLMDKGQNLVVEKEDGLELGQTLTVVRYSDELDHPATGDTVGYRYEFVAHLKTLEGFKEDEDLVSASVLRNRMGVRPGDILIPFRSVKRSVPSNYSSSEGGNHHIVGFDYPGSTIGGTGSFVFLDQNNGQLEVGSAVKLFQDVRRSALSADSLDLPETRKLVGDAYIVDNAGAVATALVLSDVSEIRTGDSTLSQVSTE